MSDISYKKYWETRYQESEVGSGSGSYADQGDWTRHELYKLVTDYEVKTVTDIGCGQCDLWVSTLPVQEENYLGLDVSESAIKKARAQYPQASFSTIDVVDLVKDTNRIKGWEDMVVCTDLLFHLNPTDSKALFDWMQKVARKVIVIKTIFGFGDQPQSFHWDYKKIFEPVLPWRVDRLEKHPYNKKAWFIVLVKDNGR